MLKLDQPTLAKLLQGNRQAIFVFERMLQDVGDTLPSTIEEANALAGQALALVQTQGALLALVTEALAQLEGVPAPAQVLPVDHDDTAPRAHLGTISSQNAEQVEITGGTAGLDAGTVAAPSFYLGGDRTTGLYRIGADNWGIAIAGTKLLDFSAAKLAITGSLTATLGATFGTGAAKVNLIVNGTNSGAAGGASYVLQNGGATILGFGNKSALVGGAYDATPYIFHVGVLTTSGSMAVGADLTASGKFGCNGKTAQGAIGLGAAATDPASTQALANNIRAALIANGIGS